MNNKIIQTPNSFLTKFNLLDIDDCEIDEKLLSDCIEYIDSLLDIKPPIKIFDKIVNQRRDVGFFSSTSIGYYFSGQLAKSKPMNTSLNMLLEAINKMFGSEFNGILINRYNSGDEYIGPLIKFL